MVVLIAEHMARSHSERRLKRFLLSDFPMSQAEMEAWYAHFDGKLVTSMLVHLDAPETVLRQHAAAAGMDAASSSEYEDFITATTPLTRTADRLGRLRVVSAVLSRSVVASEVQALLQGAETVPVYQRTLAVVKPDCMSEDKFAAVPEILEQISSVGLVVIGAQVRNFTFLFYLSFFSEISHGSATPPSLTNTIEPMCVLFMSFGTWSNFAWS